MKPHDIRVGAMYANQTEKNGGLRIVDALIKRLDGTDAVRWTSALKSTGHDSGVSTLRTFAKWARTREVMSDEQVASHSVRAKNHSLDEQKYGAQIRQFLASCKS